jgi:hypothetical protein
LKVRYERGSRPESTAVTRLPREERRPGVQARPFHLRCCTALSIKSTAPWGRHPYGRKPLAGSVARHAR